MSDDPNLVQKQKIGATILDNRKAGAIAQEFNISMLQGCKYEKSIEKYKQIKLPKGMRCYKMEFAIPLLWDSLAAQRIW